MSTEIQERPDIRPAEPGDAERFAHIIYAPGKNAAALVTESQVFGTPVEALCGKKWIPSRDPKRYPVCPECKEKADGLRRGDDGSSDDE